MIAYKKEMAFHIHTFRCRHAEQVPDEEYVKSAIKHGKTEIWFTDHAPFPGNPFGNRMDYEELPDYIESLKGLRKKYPNIDIKIGLEIEYIPSFGRYYEQLHENKDIDLLLLGQHITEISNDPVTNKCLKLGNAVREGIGTGLFGAVAHPDRIFRYCDEWTDNMSDLSESIIKETNRMKLPLEINMASLETKDAYRKEFWDLVPESMNRIIGLDAHSVEQMERRMRCEDTIVL